MRFSRRPVEDTGLLRMTEKKLSLAHSSFIPFLHNDHTPGEAVKHQIGRDRGFGTEEKRFRERTVIEIEG
jgi:hypothetical protein